MMPPAKRHGYRRVRQKGSVYVAALGASVMVTIIGLSAMFVARLQTRVAGGAAHEVRARTCAQSVIDLARLRIAADPSWRNTHAGSKWTAAESAGGGLTFQYRIVDELDGALTNDASQPARLYARADSGHAVRLYSVLLKPPEPANLLVNPGFESGAVGWSAWNCTLVPAAGAHSGAACVLLQNRATPDSEIWKDVITRVKNGQAYQVEAWAKTVSGTEQVTISFKTTASTSGVRIFVSNSVVVGTTWTKITATLTPTWLGTLTEARWGVFSWPGGGSADFYVDDALMAEQLTGQAPPIVPGTWRQETLP